MRVPSRALPRALTAVVTSAALLAFPGARGGRCGLHRTYADRRPGGCSGRHRHPHGGCIRRGSPPRLDQHPLPRLRPHPAVGAVRLHPGAGHRHQVRTAWRPQAGAREDLSQARQPAALPPARLPFDGQPALPALHLQDARARQRGLQGGLQGQQQLPALGRHVARPRLPADERQARGRLGSFHGFVRPKWNRRVVYLEKRSCAACNYHRVRSTKSGPHGYFRFVVPAPRSGRWWWRASTPATGRFIWSYSAVFTTQLS